MARAVAVALIVARAAAPSWAEPAPPAAVSAGSGGSGDAKLASRARAARLQRNLGWGLAATGIAAAIAGSATILFGYYGDRGFVQGVVDVTAGAATTAAGIALAIPGVVLAIRGQDGLTDALWLRTVVAPSAGGAVGGVRVEF